MAARANNTISNMKIGLMAFSTNTGLGYQTIEFAQNIDVEKVLIVDLSELNHVETHHERFDTLADQKKICKGIPTNKDCEWLVDGMDVVFCCETPLNFYLFEYARKRGVKTVMQYNYEFLNFFNRPDLAKPDVFAAPSKWGFDVVGSKDWGELIHWPVPVDIQKFEYRPMQETKTFVHIIGRPAIHDRNGTKSFLEAAKQLDGYNYRVYLQRPTEWRTMDHFKETEDALLAAKKTLGDRLEIVEDVQDNREMYSVGEILVLPRRYGGLCLPMWEALASGMPVIMPNISPNNTILPERWLCESSVKGTFKAATDIAIYDAKVQDLMATMTSVAESVAGESMIARAIAHDMSWEAQRPLYMKRFELICS